MEEIENIMDTQSQEARRKRVAKIKSGIVITITTWMLLSFIAIVVLSVAVFKINKTLKNASITPGNNNIQNQTPGNNNSGVLTGIDSVDNMAAEGDHHYVYLTFDGSPSNNTNAILDTLKFYNVKATFFVVGNDSEEMKSVYQRIVDEGHTLGMHSYSNQYSTIYASTDAFKADLVKLREYLKNITGVQSDFYRFPGGSGNQISDINMVDYVRVLNDYKIAYFDWNVSAGDATNDYSVEDVVNSVVSGVKDYKTSVVLLHDANNKSTTVEALGPLIEALEKMDAELLPIDENTNLIQYIHSNSVE